MQDIYLYITKPLVERQQHLSMEEPCIERWSNKKPGSGLKPLLAHVLDTTIPDGMKIYVCHACNNGRCSNPNHLYWGTAQENAMDRQRLHKKNIWYYMVQKYGLEEAKRIQSKANNGDMVKLVDTQC